MADGGYLPGLGKSQCLCVCALFLLLTSFASGLDTCIEVKSAFSEKGFDENEVPVKAISGSDLTICPQTETCCTDTMEGQLTSHSRKEHTAQLNKTFNLIQRTFIQRRRKFDEFFKELIDRAAQGLDEMFLETYGVLYRQNDQIFRDLFKQLRVYYSGTDMDLMGVMNQFFDNLLIRMFQLINNLQVNDARYMRCLTENMDKLKPFGDVPTKLGLHVKRAFIAARTFVQGLAVGRDVVGIIKEMAPTDSCVKALVRMTYCPVCKGLTSTKPCSFYCLNTMKGCLANHAELNADWNKFLDALNKLGERLDGPFNIESVVAPIDVDISNAIMNMQETGVGFTQEVVKRCGDINQLKKHHLSPIPRSKREAQGPGYQPKGSQSPTYTRQPKGSQSPTYSRKQQHLRRQQRPSSASGGGGGRKLTKSRHNSRDCSKAGNCLDRLVKDLKEKIKPAKNFWTKLPYMACQEESLASDATVQDDCWNGTDRARYVPEVQEDGVLRQINNPEVEVEVQVVNSVFNRQRIQLQQITSKLTSAYKGEHVDSVDTGLDSYVASSGSGDDVLYDDEDEDLYTDFDDDDDDDRDYDRDAGFSDDEDDFLESSGHDQQGSGSGSHGFITDEEKKGFVDIDYPPHKFTPTGSGRGSGRGRGHGGSHDRSPHRKGGNNFIGRGGNSGTIHSNRGNVPSIQSPGGGMYNPNNNNNRNIYKTKGDGRGDGPTASEGSQEGGKGAATSSSTGSVAVLLLLFSFHWLAVRRFLTPSLSIFSC